MHKERDVYEGGYWRIAVKYRNVGKCSKKFEKMFF